VRPREHGSIPGSGQVHSFSRETFVSFRFVSFPFDFAIFAIVLDRLESKRKLRRAVGMKRGPCALPPRYEVERGTEGVRFIVALRLECALANMLSRQCDSVDRGAFQVWDEYAKCGRQNTLNADGKNAVPTGGDALLHAGVRSLPQDWNAPAINLALTFS